MCCASARCTVNAASGAAAPPPEHSRPAGTTPPENPRARGHSPAVEQRGAAPEPAEQKIKVGSAEYSAEELNAAAAHKVETDLRKASLPPSPDKYEAKLPADFKPPEGVTFELDQNSPELKRFRDLAHARGVDQDTFSDMLGVYAATKIGEQQHLATARNAEMNKLGSAATQRIDAIETWLKARAGEKSKITISQLRNYPVAGVVEMFEGLIRQFSNQGGADYSQSGRNNDQPDANKIPGYATMSFEQRRAAQDAQSGRAVNAPRASGGGNR
jgi:hypothetical protein